MLSRGPREDQRVTIDTGGYLIPNEDKPISPQMNPKAWMWGKRNLDISNVASDLPMWTSD
jgi:hypothetical protein